MVEEELFEETSILIGMIVSSEFLGRVLSIDIGKYLTTKYNKMLAMWIGSYYKKYGKAPSSSITELINTQKKSVDPTTNKIIYHIIEYASDRYGDQGEEFDLAYNLDIAEKYIQSRALILRREEEERLLEGGDVLGAYKLSSDFQLPVISTDTKKNLSEVLPLMALSFDQLDDMNTPKREYLLWGQLPLEKSSVTLIVGEAGSGKTWFVMEIAKMIGSGVTGLAGTCYAKDTAKTLIVDGELPIYELQERAKILELEDCRYLTLLSKSYLEKNDVVPTLNLNEATIRNVLADYIIENKFDLVILDNLFSLFGGLDLNSAEEWSPINDWLLKLRSKNVATILCHHIGKSGDQLGSISKTFNINTHLLIKKESPQDGDTDCCCFTVLIKKQRGTGIGLPGKRFIFKNNIWITEPFGNKIIKTKTDKGPFGSSAPTPRPLTSGLRQRRLI